MGWLYVPRYHTCGKAYRTMLFVNDIDGRYIETDNDGKRVRVKRDKAYGVRGITWMQLMEAQDATSQREA